MTDEMRVECAKTHAKLQADQTNLETVVDRDREDTHKHLESMARSLDKLAGNGRKGEMQKAADDIKEATKEISAVTARIAVIDERTMDHTKAIDTHRNFIWGLVIVVIGLLGKLALALIP